MSQPKTLHYFYVSIGSNLAPERHVAQAIGELSQRFGDVLVFPIVKTEPCDIHTDHPFFNTLVIFAAHDAADTIKHWFNQLEAAHGRDRSDPMRSKKDRTLDLDILHVQQQLDMQATRSFDEPYTQVCIDAVTSPQNTQSITLGRFQLGHRPATVYTKRGSSDVFVVEDTLNRLLQRFETTLHREQGLA